MNPHRLWRNRVAYLLLGIGLGTAIPVAAKMVHQDPVYAWLTVFAEALEHIENQFVDTVQQEKLAQGAIRGLVSQLDSHSQYYPTAEFKALMEKTEGEYRGVGLEIAYQKKSHRIVRVLPNSPAEDAGLEAGDRIIAVDGQNVGPLSTETLRNTLRGTVGTQVVLSIMRDSFARPWTFTLTRQWVRKPALRIQNVGSGIRYIQVDIFARKLASDLQTQLLGPNKPKAVIVDLRDNPGGLFNEAVATADLFLSKGIIVTARGRSGVVLEERHAQAANTQGEIPVALLINEKSASAAEIVAGALQDHDRAKVFGQTSYGKGSVQNIVNLSDGSGLKITVARYLTPKGRNIEGFGIKPDVSVNHSDKRDEAMETALRWVKSQL